MVAYLVDEGIEKFDTMRVLWAYSQLAQACYYAGNWKELETCLAQLNAIDVHNQTQAMARFTYSAQLSITLYDFKGDEKMLKQLLGETISRLKEFKNRLRPDVRLEIGRVHV